MTHPILHLEEISPEIYQVSDLLLERFSRLNLWLFDLEATGLDTTRERVTQIAGIMMRHGEIDASSAFTQFVELPEGVEIPQVVRELTQITPEKLEGAPPFPDAWRMHLEAAEGADVWMGQSVFEFDVPLLLTEFERHGMPLELPGILDSVALATWLLGSPGDSERWSTSRLIHHFSVDTGDLRRHDALDDVKILGRILRPMLQQIRQGHADRVHIPAGSPIDVRRHAPVRSEG